jgi:Pyruvate/2-oxoacid:ferredoxin oxidoreductase delta subunit
MKRSTKDLFKLHGWKRFDRFLHGYIYLSRVPQYLSVLVDSFNFFTTYFPKGLARTFLGIFIPITHSKVVTFGDAKKIITLNEDLRADPSVSERVVPFEVAHSIIFENPGKIAALECPCRAKSQNCSSPKYGIQVCLVIGDPAASFCLEHASMTNAREVTQAEALEILQEAHNLGWMHTIWFRDVVDRSFAMCNCCKCCCVGLFLYTLAPKIGYEGKNIFTSSGYVAKVDKDTCKEDCPGCEIFCKFGAYKKNLTTKKAAIAYDECIGCGVCVDKSPYGAISLARDPSKGIPLDVDELTPSRVM